MNNERYCATINSRLAQLVVAVRQSSASNLRSINIHAESFFREFLNVLFGWKLSNANAVQPNAAGIDLIYPGENVVVQVSSTADHEKVQSSLEKSARFPGAHFYFVAIKDSLPKYTKAFDKHGLVFDPDADILDTTKLCDLTVKHEGYGTKKAIDVQKELFDLVEKYFSLQERRKDLHLHLLGQSEAKSLFEYNAEAVRLLGRAPEMEELKRFVSGDPGKPFSWWAITGPGAAGKTRLAYELQKQLLDEGEWDVAVISPALLDRYAREEPDLSDACPCRTLFIVDYVQKHTEALALLVKRLSDPDLGRTTPLRLLLLERDIRDEDGRIAWLEQIWGTDHHVHDCFYGRTPAPLSLSPLRAAENGEQDPLEALIRAFADKLCEGDEPEGRGLSPLPAGKEAYLRSRLEEIDPGLLRPLFAMILADAYVRDPETERWSREKLLAHIVDREWDMLGRRIAPFHHPNNRLLMDSFRLLWITATVLGAGDSPLSPERIKELLPRVWEALSKAAAKHEDKLESWTAGPEEALLQQSGLLAEGRVQPLRPDLLGEYLVLDALRRAVSAERNSFLSAVLSEFDAAMVFFGRVLDDYGALLLNDERLLDAAFPSELQTEPEECALYARLLRSLFEQPRENAIRGRLCRQLSAFAARQQGEEEALARIFNDTASVLQAMGDYQKALEYYDKALKVVETVLGPEHPSTATTYNNMAGVYQAMGDYPKALEYYEKDRRISETVLGPEHPSTATTYNNLALLYFEGHNLEEALRYSSQALAVFQRILGPDHPNTRTASEFNEFLRMIISLHEIVGDDVWSILSGSK